MNRVGIILQPVDSSMLASVGYDAISEDLVVLFNTGKAYTYRKVPLKVYLGLISAESKGKYMNEKIIGVYPAEVFSGWKKEERSTGKE
jgi:hypothetical protein